MVGRTLSALSGNNYVKMLVIEPSTCKVGEEEMRSLLLALPGNMGIEHLMLTSIEMTDVNWYYISLIGNTPLHQACIHHQWRKRQAPVQPNQRGL
jgi:hypothetical protein